MPLATPAQATETKHPIIEFTQSGVGGEVTAGAQINPEGLETTYEIALECWAPEPLGPCEAIANPPHEEGKLQADFEGHAVVLRLPGIKNGLYHFEVLAFNSAGGVLWRGSSFDVNFLPIPVNEPTPYKPESPSWVAELAGQGGAMRVAEAEAARKAREEQERLAAAAPPPAAAPVPCVVPSLKGHSLAGARRILSRSHCVLGHVLWTRRNHRGLVVITQNPGHGSDRTAGTVVSVKLGVARRP